MQNWPREAVGGWCGQGLEQWSAPTSSWWQQQGILLSKLILLQTLLSFSLPHPLQSPPSLGTRTSAPFTTSCIFCLCVELDLSLRTLSVASISGSQQHKGFYVFLKVYVIFL